MIPDSETLIDYAKTLDCIHCGLCLQTCPTFLLTGAEASSPRGRIHLMRAVAEERLEPDATFAEEMDFCLLCRHCESVCPAGVQFGAMMEFTRGNIARKVPHGLVARLARWVGFRVVLPRRLVLRALGSLLRLGQVTGLVKLAVLFGERGRGALDLPPVPPLPARRLLPASTRPAGEEKGSAAVLEGCVMPELYARVNRATVDSLAALGYRVRVPSGVTCCGSLHAHNGDLDGARNLARRMIAAYEGLDDPIVVNSAGCSAHMKELHHLFDEDDAWHARAHDFAGRVRDYTEFVAPQLEGRELRLGAEVVPGPVAWDDPCHLCHGQGVRAEPRRILDAIKGLETVPLEGSESCCGSAGIYSLLRPEDSRAIFEPKREALARSGARTLVTANPGCQLQWESGLRRAGADVRVVHIAELVSAALNRPGRNS
ncbi:MAG: (Fe-S)-binding protein [Planctomycetota bacterium]|nr:(Fe-S)-binding protein [Planctomycetota bacterium]